MIGVNNDKIYSNLLIFKFKNFELDYPKDIKKILEHSENAGDYKSFETLSTLGLHQYKKIYILGLGLTEEFNSTRLLKAFGFAVKNLKNTIEELDILDNFHEDLGYYLGQGLELALYKFRGKKEKEESIRLQKINIISDYMESINRGIIVGQSINWGRNLVNLPSNIVTPKYLAQHSEELAETSNLDIKILDKYMLEQMGMNGILYVAKGSVRSPRLIILQYFGAPEEKEIVSLIGKGVTFDSGGITLKPGKGMESMITDMAGAASVLSAMKAITKLKPKKNIIALIPTVENLPSATSYKPGDVITTYSGKTVQVISTDAEGRLILCDAITYARELGATTIIDVATLTAACANFFGGINIGLSSNSSKLAHTLIKVGNETGENIWQLPNNPEYMDLLRTDSADLKNSGTNSGGILAGLFLQSFAENTDFAHLDIAGCVSSPSGNDLYDTGANGLPARTLIEYLMA